MAMGIIAKFPYGKAPFWLLVTALLSTLTLAMVRRERPRRPDLILVTFTMAHKEAYEKNVAEFERRHGVRVEVQFAHWSSLRSRLQNAILADTDVPDMVEMLEGSLGFFTRGPLQEVGLLDLTSRIEREHLRERMVESRFSLWSARGHVFGLPHDVHPAMLAYRRDLVEELGIDVSQLDTWEKFAEVGRRITRDQDGDGVIDRYMIDLPDAAGHGRLMLMLQRGAQLFDADGQVAFNSPETAEVLEWYVRQLHGPGRTAYDCGWGQPLMKAMTDGVALFYLAPDWRTWGFQKDLPNLSGKMALMPMPRWTPGGRRTGIWGGTGLVITKRSKRKDLAWELAKFLYFDPNAIGARFQETHILPPLKAAWSLPELNQPNPYYSNQRIGRLYADLAPESPPQYTSPVDVVARNKLDEAYTRIVEHYKAHGEQGFGEVIRAELARAEATVKRAAARNAALREAR